MLFISHINVLVARMFFFMIGMSNVSISIFICENNAFTRNTATSRTFSINKHAQRSPSSLVSAYSVLLRTQPLRFLLSSHHGSIPILSLSSHLLPQLLCFFHLLFFSITISCINLDIFLLSILFESSYYFFWYLYSL